jgi:serine/threonine-protein kinase HipA
VNRCPITYEPISGDRKYSTGGLKALAPTLTDLNDLPYSAAEQRQEAIRRAGKMSIQGVQPKLSATLSVSHRCFEIVDSGGTFILKPQIDYPEVPQNEDLTMKLAALAGIETPVHGMVYSIDGSLTYFIRRFDRIGRGRKLAVEDFAQLSGQTRDTKYDFSMERLADIVDAHCTFPVIEKMKLFRLTLFNFLTGNEDAHLKNLSLITRNGKTEFSPAYDLLNTTIAADAVEEIALPLDGKKRNLNRKLLVDYFGIERLRLSKTIVSDVMDVMAKAKTEWESLIQNSFLSDGYKRKYLNLLQERRKRAELF